MLKIITFYNAHIYAIVTIIISNNYKHMFYFRNIMFKIYLFVYKRLIKSLFHFISTYIYIKADHFKNKNFHKRIIICESLNICS